MQDTKRQDDVRDDLSDAASSLAEERTLNDEPLPSYDQAPSTSIANPPEKPSIPVHNNQVQSQISVAPGPTVAEPFAFPSDELPAYEAGQAIIQRPLAIPQTKPSATAPLLLAYPTALLSFGITMDSWLSFVETLSAFLSANVSQQAVHHAADIAADIGDFHKQYALRAKQGFKSIGQSAKQLNPVGLVTRTIGITMGGVGHVIGTGFQFASSLTRRPQTPRERAAVYVETANLNWFLSRGLQAALMDTPELSKLCEIQTQDILTAAQNCGSTKPDLQLTALRDVIGEVQADEEVAAWAASKVNSSSSSKAAGKRPLAAQLQLGGTTLWLVLVQTHGDVHSSGEATSRVSRH